MFWLGLFALVAVVSIIGVIYMLVAISRFSLISRIDKKWLRVALSFAIIVAVGFIISFVLTYTDAIIVFLHVVCFFLIYGIVFGIIKRIRKKDFKIYWQGWFAIISSVIYLSIGYYLCNNVWQTTYNLKTDKNVSNVKVAMFADAHLSTVFDADGFAKRLEKIKNEKPDIVLIPGDFVDDSTTREDMVNACKAFKNLSVPYGVWFSYGNHDEGYYDNREFTFAEMEEEMKKNGIGILKDDVTYVGDLCIVGRLDGTRGVRQSIDELLANVDKDKYIIVLDHIPSDYDAEADSSADLVVSGHTHGGQLLPVNRVGELLKMNDRTYGYERRNDTDFIVTSGIACWAMNFKTGTKSEYTIININ